jgi:hypothetical protein
VVLETNITTVAGIDMSPDGKTLAVSGGMELQFWDVPSGRLLVSLKTELGSSNLHFTPDGVFLLCGSTFWNVAAREIAGSLATPGPIYFTSAPAFSLDGRYAVAGCADDTLRVWDATNGGLLKVLHTGEQPNSLLFSPDGRNLAAGGNGTLMILDEARFDPADAICLVDAAATNSGTYIIIYKKVDMYGVERTYAVPGDFGFNNIPVGATCVCNSVGGAYDPTGGGGGGTVCTCNSVCVCMAV